MQHKNYLSSLIANGELGSAITELLEATKNSGQKDFYNAIVSQASRFNLNEEEKRKGTISTENYTLAWNRIKEVIIHYLKEYDDDGFEVINVYKNGPEAINRFIPLQNHTPFKINYQEKRYSEIQSFIQKGLILLVTATETETKALQQQMQPPLGEPGLVAVKKNNATYFIGKFGNFIVVNVECGTMGTGTSMGSLITTTNAISDFCPKFIIMIGIAFGIDPQSQNIGDVLVSNGLIPYEIQRVSKNEVLWRGMKPEANNSLRNNFKSIKDWEYFLPNGEAAKLDLCDILTGEKLIDNIDFREELTKKFPTARGGEMEGAGVYTACQDKGVPWILVKSICDFADGMKKEGKEEKQALAITVALDACLHVFNKKFVFEDLGVTMHDDIRTTVKNRVGFEEDEENIDKNKPSSTTSPSQIINNNNAEIKTQINIQEWKGGDFNLNRFLK